TGSVDHNFGRRVRNRRQLNSFFFFQAEDGIRDLIVTGVQTCALPIFHRPSGARSAAADLAPLGLWTAERIGKVGECAVQGYGERSEERRVGKERRRVEATGDRRKNKRQQIKSVKTTMRYGESSSTTVR